MSGAVGLRFQFVEDACRCFVEVREMDYRLRLNLECDLMPPGYVPGGGGRERERERERERDAYAPDHPRAAGRYSPPPPSHRGPVKREREAEGPPLRAPRPRY